MKRPIDQFDIKILSALQKDGRMTIQKLSEIVGLSPSPCHARIKRLAKDGLITRYAAEVDLRKLAYATMVVVPIELANHDAKSMRVFETEIVKFPEVIDCYAVGGGFDYVIRVVARDIDAYQELMDCLLDRDIGIARYFSYIVTKPVKKFQGFPLEQLLSED